MKAKHRLFFKTLLFFLIVVPSFIGSVIGLTLLIGLHPVIGFSILVVIVCAIAAAGVAYS